MLITIWNWLQPFGMIFLTNLQLVLENLDSNRALDIHYKLVTITLLRLQEKVNHANIITTCDKKLLKFNRNEAEEPLDIMEYMIWKHPRSPRTRNWLGYTVFNTIYWCIFYLKISSDSSCVYYLSWHDYMYKTWGKVVSTHQARTGWPISNFM